MSVSPEVPARRVPRMLIGGLVAAVVGLPLAIGMMGSASARAVDISQGTMFTVARQAGAPAQFLEATFGVNSLFLHAKLKNIGNRPINQYRVGWIVVYRDGKTAASSGQVMNVPAEIAPGAVEEVPNQGISGKLLSNKPREIMFFVDEARFSTGEVWNADTHSIANEAGSQARTAAPAKDSKTEKPIVCVFASVKYPEGSVIQEGNGPEQMCARLPDWDEMKRTGRRAFYPAWIFTSKAIRKRSAAVVHLP